MTGVCGAVLRRGWSAGHEQLCLTLYRVGISPWLELGPVLGGGSGRTHSRDNKLLYIRNLTEPWSSERPEAVLG